MVKKAALFRSSAFCCVLWCWHVHCAVPAPIRPVCVVKRFRSSRAPVAPDASGSLVGLSAPRLLLRRLPFEFGRPPGLGHLLCLALWTLRPRRLRAPRKIFICRWSHGLVMLCDCLRLLAHPPLPVLAGIEGVAQWLCVFGGWAGRAGTQRVGRWLWVVAGWWVETFLEKRVPVFGKKNNSFVPVFRVY